jgi:hypothetical protein
MAWEKRGNREYFYRKERLGNKIKTVYVGRGELAALVEQGEKGRRLERKIEKAEENLQRTEFEEIDGRLDELSEFNQTLVTALFLANGFHQHKRQWRKQRK